MYDVIYELSLGIFSYSILFAFIQRSLEAVWPFLFQLFQPFLFLCLSHS